MEKSYFEIDHGLERAPGHIPGCIMDEKDSFKDGNKARFFIDRKDYEVNVEDWVNFLNNCGLVITIKESKKASVIVEFDPDDYINTGQFMTAFTAVRYGFSHFYPEIAKEALAIKRKYPKWQSIKCFQLAHYKSQDGYIDSLHMCMSLPSKLLSKKEYLEEVGRIGDGSSAFGAKPIKKDWSFVHKMAKKNLKETFEYLTNDKDS